MGYTTHFEGSISVEPPLSQEEVSFLNRFSHSRRMHRKNGPYHIGSGSFGQDHEEDIIDYNTPPPGQPGLWCQWVSDWDGTAIEWDEGEKFYDATERMTYIIDHFLRLNPIARLVDPTVVDPADFSFLQGHTLNGEIHASGEEAGDLWMIEVKDNIVTEKQGRVTYE